MKRTTTRPTPRAPARQEFEPGPRKSVMDIREFNGAIQLREALGLLIDSSPPGEFIDVSVNQDSFRMVGRAFLIESTAPDGTKEYEIRIEP